MLLDFDIGLAVGQRLPYILSSVCLKRDDSQNATQRNDKYHRILTNIKTSPKHPLRAAKNRGYATNSKSLVSTNSQHQLIGWRKICPLKRKTPGVGVKCQSKPFYSSKRIMKPPGISWIFCGTAIKMPSKSGQAKLFTFLLAIRDRHHAVTKLIRQSCKVIT